MIDQGSSTRWKIGPAAVCLLRSRQVSLLKRFMIGDEGQDVVEYALLAGFIGIAGWTVLTTMGTTVHDVYLSWLNPNTGVPSLWAPAEPLGSTP